MVVAMDQRQDVREPFENDTVAYLRAHGVDGVASYSRFGFDQVNSDKEQFRQLLQAAHQESVLFVRVTQRADFTEGAPRSLGGMDMGSVDESTYVSFTEPGGEINTGFRLGARLFRVSDGVVVWSSVLTTIMKEDTDQLVFVRKTARAFVDRMAKDNVIP
jgi:hypothetical protein